MTTHHSITKICVLIAITALLGACASTQSGARQKHTKSNKKISSKSTAPKRYQVKSGDTVAKIADRYGLSWRDISAINHLDSNHTIYAGQWLTLWQDGKQPTTNRTSQQTLIKSTAQPTISPTTKTSVNTSPIGSIGLMQFRYPVGKHNRIARNFGTIAKIDGVDSKADGMWFLGQDGDSVSASRQGQVASVENTRTGAVITIAHGDGFVSSYWHVNSMVRQGQAVNAGDKIASMKQHQNNVALLEFRIARNNVYIDPLSVLK